MSQLEGVKVLELASVLAGPSVGQFFAELGASVIKVENIKGGGDVTRTWKFLGETTDDRSAYFCSVNWGKRSLAVDLSKPEGQEIIHLITKQTDVVISSYKPGDAEKLRVDYTTLSSINPAIIYGMITGYGSSNPRVGYDAIIQAEAGFMFMNGEPGGASLKMPVALIDILAGHHLKEGLLLAMIERMKTGKGKVVEVSLIQAALTSLANQATNWLVGKKLPQKQGSVHPNIAPYGEVFRTADNKELMLAVGSDRQFSDLCNVLGLTGVINNEKFSSNSLRVQNRPELFNLLASKIKELNSAWLMTHLNQNRIPAGLIQNIKEALDMPEGKELLLQSNDVKGLRSIAAKFETFNSHFPPPPHLGQHSEEILRESLQYSSEMIEKLVNAGIIK
ncbi:CaiB/BaiF CoA transferase family protein [Chryseosolibacter indicus]|uniref:CoA transferase n=1 Tax=Chryseosolibacter indicus TaxID=2782351 RepID=A0ABS5VTI2_9BACT|nr:CoA transferase [Chryseosolibacter indicus]